MRLSEYLVCSSFVSFLNAKNGLRGHFGEFNNGLVFKILFGSQEK